MAQDKIWNVVNPETVYEYMYMNLGLTSGVRVHSDTMSFENTIPIWSYVGKKNKKNGTEIAEISNIEHTFLDIFREVLPRMLMIYLTLLSLKAGILWNCLSDTSPYVDKAIKARDTGFLTLSWHCQHVTFVRKKNVHCYFHHTAGKVTWKYKACSNEWDDFQTEVKYAKYSD